MKVINRCDDCGKEIETGFVCERCVLLREDFIEVFKAEWPEFLNWCKNKGWAFNSLQELDNALDDFVSEALRIKTKYDN